MPDKSAQSMYSPTASQPWCIDRPQRILRGNSVWSIPKCLTKVQMFLGHFTIFLNVERLEVGMCASLGGLWWLHREAVKMQANAWIVETSYFCPCRASHPTSNWPNPEWGPMNAHSAQACFWNAPQSCWWHGTGWTHDIFSSGTVALGIFLSLWEV